MALRLLLNLHPNSSQHGILARLCSNNNSTLQVQIHFSQNKENQSDQIPALLVGPRSNQYMSFGI